MATYETNAIQAGIGNTTVSNQWWSRPDDQKFLTLASMKASKVNDASRLSSRVVDTHRLEVLSVEDEANPTRGGLSVRYEGTDAENVPTHWSTGQLAGLAGAPAGYLRDLPAPLAADCLNWGMRYNRGRESIKVYGSQDDGGELRAATGPDYGRIFDHEIIDPVMRLVEQSGGRWKVPGMMTSYNNGMAVYDPEVPVSLDTTTLFASDRDVFIFLVDDRNPIEVGRLPNGNPDLLFRGFYTWNSEVGQKTAGIAAMYLRGVCMNRCLWGVENFSEIKIRHTKFAPDRFAQEARPALQSFASGNTQSLREGVAKAKEAVVARDDEARMEFLTKRAGLSRTMAKAATARHLQEEERPIENVWDAAQGITAIARDVPHQDTRVILERKAGALLDKVAA